MNKELILKKIKKSLPQQLREELGLFRKNKKIEDKTYSPTEKVKKTIEKGLKLYDPKTMYLPPKVLKLAEQIANGEDVLDTDIYRIFSFFERTEVEKSSDPEWMIWGGFAGQDWSKEMVEKSSMSKELIRKMEPTFYFEPGTHGHGLARDMLMTMKDGGHIHYFAVPLVNGETLILRSEYDGEHAHGLEDFKSTETQSETSFHKHVVRVPFDTVLTNGEELESGEILVTEKDGFHEHEADQLHHTTSSGAHVHTLQLTEDFSVKSIDLDMYFDLFGFDIAKESGCVTEVMLGMEEGPDISDDKRAALAMMGYEVKKSDKISAFGRNTIQEVRFEKSKFKNRNDIDEWLQDNGHPVPQKVNEAGERFIARLRAPSEFVEKTMKTISIGGGVKVVTGMRKEDVDMDLVEKQTEIQSLIFDKKKFTEDKAKKWAKDNDFSTSKIDETGGSFRIRQLDPEQFSRLRTVALTEGVKAVVGVTKQEAKKEDVDDGRLHVDDPTGKIKNKVQAEILKADDEKMEVLGIVLEPDELDAQDHMISAEEIEKAQRFHMQNSQVIGFRHQKKEKADLVESYIAPANFTISGPNGKQKVKKGSWLVTVKINDKKRWQQVKEKKINAFSVGGFSDLADEGS